MGSESFIARPTEVLLGFMSTVGRPRDRGDFDYGRVSVMLEVMTRARFLNDSGLVAEGVALESLLQDLGMEERVYAIYEKLVEWRRTGFVAVGGGLSPLAWTGGGGFEDADVAIALDHGIDQASALASADEALDLGGRPRGNTPPEPDTDRTDRRSFFSSGVRSIEEDGEDGGG